MHLEALDSVVVGTPDRESEARPHVSPRARFEDIVAGKHLKLEEMSQERGQGAIWRTTTAAFFLAFLNNGFNLLQIDPIWQRLIEGAVIIMAVAVDTWTKNRRA